MAQDILTGIDALLITNPVNIQYLTGFVSVAPDARESYLLITENRVYLFTNSLYTEQAKLLSKRIWFMKGSILEIISISRDNPLSTNLSTLSKKLHIQRLGFEENNVTVAEYTHLKKELGNITLVPTRERIEEMRMIKRADEIKHIRAAAKLTDQTYSHILPLIKPGISEAEIAWEIESYIRKHGGTLAFSPIVAFGEHSSQPHYQKMNYEPLPSHQLVLLDFGARIRGYCSDMTRVVFVGTPKSEWITAYRTVLEAQIASLLYLDDPHHRSGKHADVSTRDMIKQAGLPPYSHSLGHAVGLEIHESPRLTAKKDAVLHPNMVVTVEPAIYKEGAYGIRIEDLVLITENGIERLSLSPKELLIL